MTTRKGLTEASAASKKWIVRWFSAASNTTQGAWVFDTRKEADAHVAAVKVAGRLEIVGPLPVTLLKVNTMRLSRAKR